MKPPPFQYHDPKTLAEAVGLLGTLDNAKLLAGGQSLMPMLNMRFVLPDHVIDLNRVEGLSYIKEAGGALEIGAMTRQRDLEFSDLVKAKCPLLHQAIMHIGHRQTRNRGTIGGSLCHLDPAAELVSVAAAHDATVMVAGPNGTREIAFKDFPAGYLTPAIELNEIVTAVRIPLWPAGHKAAFIEFSRRHGDFAIVSAAALLEIDGGKIARASLTIGGVAVAPVRAAEVEKAHHRAGAVERAVRQGLRKLPRDRGDGRHPCLRRLPPASRRGAVAPRAGEGRGARRQRAVEPGALAHDERREFIAALGGAAVRGRSPRARSRRCRWSGFSAARRRAGFDAPRGRVPPGPEGSRLRRGPERRDRISAMRTIRIDRLPALVADLVRRPVAVIVGEQRLRRLRPRPRPRRSRSCSRPAATRSRTAWSPASTGRAAMSPA